MSVSREKFDTFLTKDVAQQIREERHKQRRAAKDKEVLDLLRDVAMSTRTLAKKLCICQSIIHSRLRDMERRGLLEKKYEPESLHAYWIARR